ncbi:MAG: hypothetical protein MZV63_38760 [Marinilabiliales bacterium]|nr:hypothetical protein [Marinilabiliales bacterium]
MRLQYRSAWLQLRCAVGCQGYSSESSHRVNRRQGVVILAAVQWIAGAAVYSDIVYVTLIGVFADTYLPPTATEMMSLIA